MSRTRFELKSILTKHCLPGGTDGADRGCGVPFTFYWCKDDHSLWLAGADGKLANLTALLLGGEGAATGADGNKLSMLPGPKGDKGDKGEQGPPGEVTLVGPDDLKAAVTRLREQKKKYLASLRLQLERNKQRQPTNGRQLVDSVLRTLEAEVDGK